MFEATQLDPNAITHSFRSCHHEPAAPTADLANAFGVGSIVGSYRITQLIGCGGMGAVYEAVHSVLPRRVAIKVLHPELCRTPGMDARMLQEATILDQLRHPGIVGMFDCGLLEDRRPWIAMQLVIGESLAATLARVSCLPSAEVCRLVAALADVLEAAHAIDIVHRDLKPDNVLFADPKTGCPVRIIDWGVAHLGAASRLTLEGVTCGTPLYMSPEQANGYGIGAPCDIYSLGVIAYEALTGNPPFEGGTLAAIVSQHLFQDAASLSTRFPALPARLCALVHRMLDKRPSARPTAAEVRDTMRRIDDELAGPVPEFESYDVTPDEAEREVCGVSARLRWTPEVRVHGPRALAHGGARMSSTSCEASGEIQRAH